MDSTTISILVGFIGVFVGGTSIFVVNSVRMRKAATKVGDLLENAKKEAEQDKKTYLLEAKEEINKIKEENEKKIREERNEIKELEERLFNREKNIDRRDETLQNKENSILAKENDLTNKQKEIQEEQSRVEELKKEQLEKLEQISGLSKKEAYDLVLKKVEDQMSLEIAALVKEKEEEAKLTSDKTAKSLLVSSMQRYAGDVANEQTITVVSLPSDDLKGRIIGREGRNIRTIEAVTGVDLIIDDTPEAIVLSSFDPFRREIARITIDSLIQDGRIHPARIEELYDKTTKEMSTRVREYGEAALFELGITKVDAELVEILGKLHFRTSYGQNALQHSIEVAHLAGTMAGEIGENIVLAKRAGLFHDIGKAIDHEIEGSHVDLGNEIASKYNENEVVIDAIKSHHGDEKANSVIAELVAIADTLSASRPGARNDSLENYVKRLQELEAIGNKTPGVEKTFAIQAGRELRVIVKPEEIDDLASYKVARDIKNKIEAEMQYPGTIKVTVIRETRAIEEAK